MAQKPPNFSLKKTCFYVLKKTYMQPWRFLSWILLQKLNCFQGFPRSNSQSQQDYSGDLKTWFARIQNSLQHTLDLSLACLHCLANSVVFNVPKYAPARLMDFSCALVVFFLFRVLGRTFFPLWWECPKIFFPTFVKDRKIPFPLLIQSGKKTLIDNDRFSKK